MHVFLSPERSKCRPLLKTTQLCLFFQPVQEALTLQILSVNVEFASGAGLYFSCDKKLAQKTP